MTSQPSTGFEDQAQHRLQSISTRKNRGKPPCRQGRPFFWQGMRIGLPCAVCLQLSARPAMEFRSACPSGLLHALTHRRPGCYRKGNISLLRQSAQKLRGRSCSRKNLWNTSPSPLWTAPSRWKCARPNIGSWVDLDTYRYDFSVPLTVSDDVYAWDPADNGRPLPPVEPDHRDPPSGLSLAIPSAVVAGILLFLVFVASRDGEE